MAKRTSAATPATEAGRSGFLKTAQVIGILAGVVIAVAGAIAAVLGPIPHQKDPSLPPTSAATATNGSMAFSGPVTGSTIVNGGELKPGTVNAPPRK